MRIGELARAAGCDAQTVRHYEREGLLPRPARDRSGYRDYDGDDLERLRFIRRCRGLQMPLREVRVLLDHRDQPERGCGEVNEVVARHLAAIESKIDSLQALYRSLLPLHGVCDDQHVAGECEVLEQLGGSGRSDRGVTGRVSPVED